MPRSLGVEIARFRKYPEEQRKDSLNRAVVKHGFFMPIQNLQITRYFDYHTVTRYIAAKYRLRQYAIEELNKQILYLVQQKNNLKAPPVLKMINLLTQDNIKQAFEDWENGKLSNDDFINYLKINKY